MRRSLFYLLFYTLLVVIIASSCQHSAEDYVNPDMPGVQPPLDTLACDSTHVTYNEVVYPILAAHCISCHSGPGPAGGLNFSNYEDVAWVAQSGQLLGSIKHMDGFSPMPQNGPKLSACEIALVEKWISDTTFTPGGGSDSSCDPDTVYFQNDILPLLMSSCGIAGCHDEQTAEKDIILTSYFHVMQSDIVEAFNPQDSEMYEKIIDDDPDKRMPPPPQLALNQSQKDMIYLWISQGALDNSCEDGDCDTLNVTFSATILPMIQNRCMGCHSGPDPQGGLHLDSYAAISSAGAIEPGNPGSLLGAVTWAPGNVPMPDNGPQLPACNTAQIRKWIEDGMPDN